MKKILIVEDNEFLRNAYKMRLEHSNYEFEVANNGEEGLAMMRSFKPHVVVLDLKMPIMDGFEVLEAVRGDEQLKKIPIVVASSIGEDDLIDRALNMGARGYIYKEENTLRDIIMVLEEFIKKPVPAKK